MPHKAYCPSCGTGLSESDSFCGHCGHQIRERERPSLQSRRERLTGTPSEIDGQCESCNAPLRAGDLFCPDCGHKRPTAHDRERLGHAAWQDLKEKLDGATTGEFEILRELGRGGMGAVYLALELALDRLVAIKVLLPNLLNQPSLVERFRNEARIVAALRHPSIVNIHTVRHLDDVHFFVMDYIQGSSLQQVIREHGPLPVPVVRAVLHQVGGALAYAHRQGRGVIHRDVKPSNIMLDPEGGAMVMDFGISKVLHAGTGLTQAGTVMGTPEYMSPEQCRGDDLTPASDQYALGLVGYAMLTGGPPFSGTKYAVFVAQLQKEPPLIRSIRSDCPQDLAEAVERMLAKRPEDRWPDIRAALQAIGARPAEHGDPVRDEIAALVRAAAGSTSLPVPVAEVLVAPPPAEVYPGDRFVLDATPTDYLGRTILGREMTWSSADGEVLAVSPDGTAEALAAGRAEAAVACEGKEARIEIAVSQPIVASVEIRPPHWTVRAGDAVPLEALARDKRGRVLVGRRMTWSTGDPALARIGTGGLVDAEAPGEVEVVAECEGRRGTLCLVIEPPPAASVEIRSPPPVVRPGDRFQLEATPRDRNGREIPDRAPSWVGSDRSVATVSPEGQVVAVDEGTVSVTARIDGVESSVTFTVMAPVVREIRLPPAPQDLRPGDRVELDPILIDDLGERVTRRSVTWRSSRPDVLRPLGGGAFIAAHHGNVRLVCSVGEVEASREIKILPPVQSATVPSLGRLGPPGDTEQELQPAPHDGDRRKNLKVVWLGISVGAVLVAAALGLPFFDRATDEAPAAPVAGPAAVPAPVRLTVAPGDIVDLSLLLPPEAPAAGGWRLADPDHAAIVTLDAKGGLEANREGDAVVLADVGGRGHLRFPVRVLGADAPSLSIHGLPDTVPVGFRGVLSATTSSPPGARAEPVADARWIVVLTSAPGILDLFPDGTLVATAPGHATLLVHTDQASARATVVVQGGGGR